MHFENTLFLVDTATTTIKEKINNIPDNFFQDININSSSTADKQFQLLACHHGKNRQRNDRHKPFPDVFNL